MKYYVFKTNIQSKNNLSRVKKIFRNYPVISEWSIDTNDADNVLRVKADISLNEMEVALLIKSNGFYCEALPD